MLIIIRHNSPFQDFLHLEHLTTYKIQHLLVLLEQECGD